MQAVLCYVSHQGMLVANEWYFLVFDSRNKIPTYSETTLSLSRINDFASHTYHSLSQASYQETCIS